MRHVVLAAASLLVFSATAHEPDLPALQQCQESAIGMDGMRECSEAELQRQQTRLSHARQALLGHLDGTQRQQLPAVERHWEQWRDARCRFQAPDSAGSLQPLQRLQCEIALTGRLAHDWETLADSL